MPDHLRPLQRSKKQKETFKFYAIYEQLPLECIQNYKVFLSHLVITHKNKRSSCFRYTAFNDTVNIIYRWKRNQ